ncbi:MAG: zf-HC2 domain-containing protein [Planctomycetes bacterium]|nr:zf-HC2 domain-containing protein [Planctomycetota bacterium]
MACASEWGVLLSKLVDGEIAPDEKLRVESHLKTCPPCTRTLDLFQRNEKVLESALAGEAFGDLVVDGVLAEVRRLETPPVVAPSAEGATLRERIHRLWPAAAAAAIIFLNVGLLLALRSEVSTLRGSVDELAAERHVLIDEIAGMSKELLEAQRGPNRSYAMTLPTNSIDLKATFQERDKIASFEVQRSQDDGKTWTTLARDLAEPSFEDRTAQEGTLYDYRFIGHLKDGGQVEATRIRMYLPVPGGLDPSTSLEITFVGATFDLTQATFDVQRLVDGKPKKQWCTVAAGKPIGTGEFATNLVLDRITVADEMMLSGERAIGRLNKLAKLRAVDAKVGDPTLDLWRGSSKRVPLPER